MTPDDIHKQLEQLKEENRRLRQQLFPHQSLNLSERGKNLFRKLAHTASTLVAGKGLKASIGRLYDELPHNVSKDTMAEVSSHIIWRVTRIGVFAIAAAVIPLFVMMIQTTILGIQNDKLDYQNELISNQNIRLDQQVQLDEGNRRSSFIFLMSNIMDKIDEELKNSNNRTRQLSDELIGRIAALSQALLPYRYLENDELTPESRSPERGQLLFALINSLLDEGTLDKIYEKSNFSYAELKQANFTGAYLRNINLEHAHFQEAVFRDADLSYAKLNQADLTDSHLEDVNLEGGQLRGAILHSTEIVNVNFANANLYGMDFRESRINGDFTNCQLDKVQLEAAEIEFALLDGAHFESTDWLDHLDETKLKGLFSIRENYEMVSEAVLLSNSKTDTLYHLRLKEGSHLSMMGDCERKVLDMIKSAPEVKALIARTLRLGKQILYLTESNPFGSKDLGIKQDSVYLFRITTENADFMNVLMWVQFNPYNGELLELPQTESGSPRNLEYSQKMWRNLPDYCF